MKIDAHQHFWNPARGDYGWMDSEGAKPLRRQVSPRDMVAHLKAHGVDRTVLVQAAPTVQETEYMLGLADATDFIAKVVGWVDFESRDDLKHLQRFARHPKFSGVRPMIQDLPDTEWMHRADVQWAYDAIIDLDLSFDALGYPIHLDAFQRLFDRYPNMRIVVDHCMKPVIRENQFALASTDDLRVLDSKYIVSSQAEAMQAMSQLLSAQPEMAGQVQVVAMHEADF